MEGVVNFKYLGRSLDQTNDDWTELRLNVKQTLRVWGILGKTIRREGVDTKVAEIF